MDNYIYFRVLDYLAKHEPVTKSDLIVVAGLNWSGSPVPILEEKKLIVQSDGVYKGAIYYKLTDSGKELYRKMKLFYDTYNDMLSKFSVRKLKVRGFNV